MAGASLNQDAGQPSPSPLAGASATATTGGTGTTNNPAAPSPAATNPAQPKAEKTKSKGKDKKKKRDLDDKTRKYLFSVVETEAARPHTPSDQGIVVEEPKKPRRPRSKGTLQADTEFEDAAPTSRAAAPASASAGASASVGASVGAAASASAGGYGHGHGSGVGYPAPDPAVAAAVAATAAQVIEQSGGVRGLLGPPMPSPGTAEFMEGIHAMNLLAAEDDLHPAQKMHRDQICDLHQRLCGFRTNLRQQPGITVSFVISFDTDLQGIMINTAQMNRLVDDLARELYAARGVQERVRVLEAALREREEEIRDWKARFQNAEKTLASLAGRAEEDLKALQYLNEKVRHLEMARTILQDQVNGKRSLWLKSQEKAEKEKPSSSQAMPSNNAGTGNNNNENHPRPPSHLSSETHPAVTDLSGSILSESGRSGGSVLSGSAPSFRSASGAGASGVSASVSGGSRPASSQAGSIIQPMPIPLPLPAHFVGMMGAGSSVGSRPGSVMSGVSGGVAPSVVSQHSGSLGVGASAGASVVGGPIFYPSPVPFVPGYGPVPMPMMHMPMAMPGAGHGPGPFQPVPMVPHQQAAFPGQHYPVQPMPHPVPVPVHPACPVYSAQSVQQQSYPQPYHSARSSQDPSTTNSSQSNSQSQGHNQSIHNTSDVDNSETRLSTTSSRRLRRDPTRRTVTDQGSPIQRGRRHYPGGLPTADEELTDMFTDDADEDTSSNTRPAAIAAKPLPFPAVPRGMPFRMPIPALVEIDLAAWEDDFRSLYALVYGFCATYFHDLPIPPVLRQQLSIGGQWYCGASTTGTTENKGNDNESEAWLRELRSASNGQVWDYMCSVCRTVTAVSEEAGPSTRSSARPSSQSFKSASSTTNTSASAKKGPRKNGVEPAMRLLRDRHARVYLLQRMIVQHLVILVCGHDGWKDFSGPVDGEMKSLEAFLANPGLTPVSRQAALTRRAELITSVLEAPNAASFRHRKLNQHNHQLKALMRPFLTLSAQAKSLGAHNHTNNPTNYNLTNNNPTRIHPGTVSGNGRASSPSSQSNSSNSLSTTSTTSASAASSEFLDEAFYDLHAITTAAWDLSTRLMQAKADFHFIWSDIGTKFAGKPKQPAANPGAHGNTPSPYSDNSGNTPEIHEALACFSVGANMQKVEKMERRDRELAVVRLCVTPLVTVRSDGQMKLGPEHQLLGSEEGSLTVVKAGVLALVP
ncbi:hypothetical protein B0J18DRAFT_480037 [Chaetomium sp. MPI-SDFR-AT-0129]|nr:hypothetical protein B0J18DRAFT_480037 [Chaetomium sp. MPI-SDFR-AT-0129]